MLKSTKHAEPDDVAVAVTVAATPPIADDEGVVSTTSTVLLLIGMLVRVLPVIGMSVADVEVILAELGVFVSERIGTLLGGLLDAKEIVDEVGTPRIDNVPDKSIVEAAFASALAVGGKPKTLQIFAMAPKVAIKK